MSEANKRQEGDEPLIATLPVTFARRRTVDPHAFGTGYGQPADATPLRLGRGPSLSAIGAYRRWAADAESGGFPVAGMAMILGLTPHDLVVFSSQFLRSRPKRRAGAVPLLDIVQMTAMRSIVTARVVVLLHDGAIIELETMRVSRARRFVAALVEQRAKL